MVFQDTVFKTMVFSLTLFSDTENHIIKYRKVEIVMVRLRILEILEEQGKTKYWLSKKMEMHYVSFKKMVENNTDSIRFETLDKMSSLLNVPVGDLFEKIDEEKN